MWCDDRGREQQLFVYRVLFGWGWPTLRRLSDCVSPETAAHFALRVGLPVYLCLAWIETWLVRVPLLVACLVALRLLLFLPWFECKPEPARRAGGDGSTRS